MQKQNDEIKMTESDVEFYVILCLQSSLIAFTAL